MLKASLQVTSKAQISRVSHVAQGYRRLPLHLIDNRADLISQAVIANDDLQIRIILRNRTE
ncbi:hypothetical protein CF161_24653 [Pseudomonas sp. CF161]|nr:hypothetical protein CF161_24653 [Pseudomonas sp. CF161]